LPTDGKGEEDIPPALLAMASAGQTKTLHSYGQAAMTIQLADSDIDGVILAVPELPPAATP
jgi:hypothetical protein